MTQQTLTEAQEALKIAQQNLTDTEAQVLAELNPLDLEMAEHLHLRSCRRSHEDMCSWEWDKIRAEGIDWTTSLRRRWLLKARLAREAGLNTARIAEMEALLGLIEN